MGKPAARVGDMHNCPKVDVGTKIPHVGGVINPPGNGTVLIGGEPAAVAGDGCKCEGEPDKITGGSSGVFIGGKPAARIGDACAHGGVITGGFGTVLIGERGTSKKVKQLAAALEKEWKEPSTEEKAKAINKAIKTAIKLLTHKLQMLERNEYNTVGKFKGWFGKDDDEAKEKICNRIRKSLSACKMLSVQSFIPIYNEDNRVKETAQVYNEDYPPVIYIGNLFWKCRRRGRPSHASVIIHELSHFKYIGETEDVIYGRLRCKELAKGHPDLAMKNAESYEFFIVT